VLIPIAEVLKLQDKTMMSLELSVSISLLNVFRSSVWPVTSY